MNRKTLSAAVLAILLAVIALLQNMGVLPESVNSYVNGEVYLHVIDVGQGSSTLIQQGNEGILIDAGEADYGGYVSEYINACGIDSLKYVVASHPHSDHIGGLPKVLKEIKTEEILMPEIDEKFLPTTKVYERLLDAIIEQEITATYCEVGDVYTLGDIKLQILGPVEQISDLNNMSAICRLSVGDTDVLVPADAERKELGTCLSNGGNFESEILLMAHHGSENSLHSKFLAAVDPMEAVISCGKENSYGHPHDEVIDYLTENNIEYWRTDYSGDIVYKLEENAFERIDY